MAQSQSKSQHVVLINPPELRGHSNERTYSGGIGVARKLKPFEKDSVVLPPIDMLYCAAVAEQKGFTVALADLLLDRYYGEQAVQYCLERVGPERGKQTWVGIRLSIPS